MRNGAEILRAFLEQVLSKGLLNQSIFDTTNLMSISTRLVDCQIPTAARRIKSMIGLEHNPDTLVQFAAELRWLSNIVLFLERFDHISLNSRLELWQACGGTIQKTKVLETHGIADEWAVRKVTFSREDSLMTRKTWILGKDNGLWLCLIDYAFGQEKLPENVKPGTKFFALAHLYPGLSVSRALIAQVHPSTRGSHPDTGASTSISQLRLKLARIYASNPFTQEIPISVSRVTADLVSDSLRLTDSEQDCLMLSGEPSKYEEITAISGGQPITMSLLYLREKFEIISTDYH